jgi:predicted nuclease with RNAse H fold
MSDSSEKNDRYNDSVVLKKVIPEWSTNGELPPGVHFAAWQELDAPLSFNPRRHRMLAGFRRACAELRKAGCRLVYLDGSFVT